MTSLGASSVATFTGPDFDGNPFYLMLNDLFAYFLLCYFLYFQKSVNTISVTPELCIARICENA